MVRVGGVTRREDIEPFEEETTMRKLAPLFITTSVLALAAGNVLANDMNSTDKTGSPTVSDNSQKQPLSYSDKSNTAKGTNAKMNDKSATGVTTSGSMSSTGDKLNADNVNSQTSFASDEDKRDAKPDAQAGRNSDLTPKPAKAKKQKVSHAHHTKMHKDTVARDETVTNTPTEKVEKNPPLSATKGEAANSTTGKSAGGQ
jgi:hypothetical protein